MASTFKLALIALIVLFNVSIGFAFLDRKLQDDDQAEDVVEDTGVLSNGNAVGHSLLSSLLDETRLTELYDAIRNNGDDNIRSYLDETFGNMHGFQRDIQSLTSFTNGNEDSNVDGAVRQARDCSFTAIDRECFIINYAGFIGRTWGTEQFDIDKAKFIVSTFLTNSNLLETVSDIMCQTADLAMPIFAGDTPITSEDVTAFFQEVATNCAV